MDIPSEVIAAIGGLIVALAGTVVVLALSLRGMATDTRESNRLAMANAGEFSKLIIDVRREADAHQAQRAEWEREGRELRDKLDNHADRIRELEQGCEEYDAQIEQQTAEIAALQVRVAELTTAVAERDERIARLNERIEALERENGRLTREEGKWQADREAWEKERQAWERERDELRAERGELAARIVAMEQEIEALKQRGTGPLPEQDEVTGTPPGADVQASEPQPETPEEAEETER